MQTTWSLRLSARTRDFHSLKRSSTLLGTTHKSVIAQRCATRKGGLVAESQLRITHYALRIILARPGQHAKHKTHRPDMKTSCCNPAVRVCSGISSALGYLRQARHHKPVSQNRNRHRLFQNRSGVLPNRNYSLLYIGFPAREKQLSRLMPILLAFCFL